MSKNVQLLYLVQAGDFYKIGISHDVNKRLAGLQTGNCHKVTCLAYYQTQQPASKVERALHKLFDKYRMNGEWFDFQGRFTQEKFDTLCVTYGMTKLPFNEDGSCKVVENPKKAVKKRSFGDIPTGGNHRLPDTNVEYWRKKYGICKKKG